MPNDVTGTLSSDWHVLTCAYASAQSPNASKQPSVRNTQAVSLLSSSSNGRGAPTTPDAQVGRRRTRSMSLQGA